MAEQRNFSVTGKAIAKDVKTGRGDALVPERIRGIDRFVGDEGVPAPGNDETAKTMIKCTHPSNSYAYTIYVRIKVFVNQWFLNDYS